MNNTTSSPAPLSVLAAAVAAALPGKWVSGSVYPDSVCAHENQKIVRESDGLELFLAGSFGGWAARGRIRVSFVRPRNKGSYVDLWNKVGSGKVADPEISVAETKTPEKIARDIESRLLPESEIVFILAKEKIAEQNAYQDAKSAAIEKVAKLTGNESKFGHTERTRETFYLHSACGPSRDAQIRVNSATSFDITVSTPSLAQATALIEFLKSPAYLRPAAV